MASLPVQLFFWPSSYYSQKVVLALEEKNVKYKATIISLIAYEQNEPWFLRLNPKGEVPMLKLGDTYFTQSETIVDTVDKLNNAPVLVPDPSTPVGKQVEDWRSKLNSINMEGLTFGVLLNPELAVTEIKIPSSYRQTKEEYRVKTCKAIEKMEKLREKYPDLKDAYDVKIEKSKKRSSVWFEKSDTSALIEELLILFDELEAQLRKSRTDNIIEHWLCGATYTAADITLCVLLGRLQMIGLLPKYLDQAKRPALIEYWNQAQLKPSVQKAIFGGKRTLMLYEARKAIVKVAAGAVVAGGVVALGLIIGQKYKS